MFQAENRTHTQENNLIKGFCMWAGCEEVNKDVAYFGASDSWRPDEQGMGAIFEA